MNKIDVQSKNKSSCFAKRKYIFVRNYYVGLDIGRSCWLSSFVLMISSVLPIFICASAISFFVRLYKCAEIESIENNRHDICMKRARAPARLVNVRALSSSAPSYHIISYHSSSSYCCLQCVLFLCWQSKANQPTSTIKFHTHSHARTHTLITQCSESRANFATMCDKHFLQFRKRL